MQEQDIKYKKINLLDNIIKLLEENLEKIENDKTYFNDKINLYGIINYSRNQYFPQLSSFITKNEDYSDIFFNYTTAESMILDLFMVIESDLILILDEKINYSTDKMQKIVIFSIILLKILKNILQTKYEHLNKKVKDDEYENKNNVYTQNLFQMQNQFYTIVYDEKIDFRIK